MSIPCSFASHAEARKSGWFSRRHQTHDEHYETQRRWIGERAAKREREVAQREESERYKAAVKAKRV